MDTIKKLYKTQMLCNPDIYRKFLLAIDPGSTESGFALIDAETYRPIQAGKAENEEILKKIDNLNISACAIEMVACYGMPVGAEVFDTCVWIGRFVERLSEYLMEYEYIYRKDEKINLCGSMKANDATIRQALADRFAKGQKNFGKGTKKVPGWFYGFSKDAWQAYAVGVTYLDKKKERRNG